MIGDGFKTNQTSIRSFIRGTKIAVGDNRKKKENEFQGSDNS